MKFRIHEIKLHAFKNFPELTYSIASGKLYGGSGVGKTNLLNAISALFVNSSLDGSKIYPLMDEAKTGWVKITYSENDGMNKELYRAWQKTDTGCSSSNSLTKAINKSLFLSILNPLYVFSLETADRIEWLLNVKYSTENDPIVTNEVHGDVSNIISGFVEKYGHMSLAKLNATLQKAKEELKKADAAKITLDAQIAILDGLIDPDAQEKKQMLLETLDTINEVITKYTEIKESILCIKNELVKKAAEDLNKNLGLTEILENGSIIYSGYPLSRISSSELMDCGLEIANMVAGRYNIVPPTVIDNANAFGHDEIELSLYPNLSQIITTSYADVELSEYNNGFLYGMNRSWKKPVETTFRPEIKITMCPYEPDQKAKNEVA